MTTVAVKVDSERVTVALGAFALTVASREQLLRTIGLLQLSSVRRTFRESGSPAGSWRPLAASTLKKYKSAGHKLLINTGRLLNSITFAVMGNSVVIGTNVSYAAVQQFGSADRGNTSGPRTEEQHRSTVRVGAHQRETRTRWRGSRLGTVKVSDKNGRVRTVHVKRSGPENRRSVNVSGHSRHQNIPARPYLVFRPEDPGRIQQAVGAYVVKSAQQAGLEAN